MITRRTIMQGAAALTAGAALAPATLRAQPTADSSALAALDPLETMIRLRARTDGGLSMAWLDAQRSLYLDGEITPFCRLYAYVITKFRREGDAFVGNTVEVTYYCDPVTSERLETVQIPGADGPAEVPIYRSGPTDVRFKMALDEWEYHDPAKSGAATAAFAPAAAVHLVRGVHQPELLDGNVYLRADEYGRVYTDRSKPPTVFYREWIVWKADFAKVLQTDNPDVESSYSYSAASGLRPWMKLGDRKGHTMENGVGAKVASVDQLPPQLIKLLEENDPKALHDPESLLT